MIFSRFFGKKKQEPEYDPSDLRITDLKKGFVVDYDLKTWQVTAEYEYDWGGGFFTKEYKLDSGTESLYLHIEDDDELELSLSRKVGIRRFEEDIRAHFADDDLPPESVTLEGKTYHRIEESLGYFRDVSREGWSELASYTYEDDDEETFVNIERWGEEEFEASYGTYADEYEFSNILPNE
ncbi:DUF4178 domain-containing protein [Roseivirga sp. BDSF3-8]|uniref:DUF4178 domain-containing protein n=1 Tax=Roseivirga sp. BDSF3-8 TaxID=3241598 RepID=UPI003531AFD4